VFAATVLLSGVTGFLAYAAFKALDQLAEVKRDRHVQFFADFSARWQDVPITEAIALQNIYGREDSSASSRKDRPSATRTGSRSGGANSAPETGLS
jgi:hypothetical protein